MNLRRLLFSFSLAALLLALFAFDAAEAASRRTKTDKIDRAVTDAIKRGANELVPVIVRTKPGRRAALRSQVQTRGGNVGSDFASIEAFDAEVRASELAILADDEAVESISIDAPIDAQNIYGDDQDEAAGYMAALVQTLGLDRFYGTGMNVGIAVIDSGIRGAYDVDVVAAYEVKRRTVNRITPGDDFGHGSHVASLMSASGSRTGYDYRGVASRARLYALKVLDKYGSGRTSDVIAAIELATANRLAWGIDIINLSLGHPIYEPAATDPLVQAVEAATRAGIVVVVSAGNCGAIGCSASPLAEAGYGGITSPGNAPSAITVGAYDTKYTATRSDDTIPWYSSRGPSWYDGHAKPDLVAPGHGMIANGDVKSQLYKYMELRLRLRQDGKYSRRTLRLSGTSMAAGVTTGVVALMIEANRLANNQWFSTQYTSSTFTPNIIKAILQFTAIPLRDSNGAEYDELTQGAGGLNAGGAVALAQAINTSATAGSYWLRTPVKAYTTFGAETYAWGQKIVWGYNLLFGNLVTLNDPAWARSVAWGDQTPLEQVSGNARKIVWGYHVVEGAGIPWTQNIVWGNDLLGELQDQKIVWGYVTDPANVVYGNLRDSEFLGDNKIVWGYGF